MTEKLFTGTLNHNQNKTKTLLSFKKAKTCFNPIIFDYRGSKSSTNSLKNKSTKSPVSLALRKIPEPNMSPATFDWKIKQKQL